MPDPLPAGTTYRAPSAMPDTRLVRAALVGVLLLLFGLAARRAKDPVPRGLRNMLEVLIVFLRDEVHRVSQLP